MTWAGVVLDVDDTLYLERDYVRSGFDAVGAHVMTHYGIGGFGDVAWAMFQDGHRGDTFDAVLASISATDVSVGELVEVYRSHSPKIELLDDSTKLLHDLEQARLPVGVITDGPAASQRAKITALGLDKRADVIVVTADLGPGRSKPHEAAFLRVEDAFGLRGDNLVYMADNPDKDFVAPHRLGWGTVRVRRPGSLHEEVDSDDDVALEINDLGELDVA